MTTVTRTANAVERAYARFEVKAVREDERIIEGIATTPSPDRVGDVVEPLGAEFKLPLPLLWQHNHDMPIGHVEFGEPTKKGIKFRARLVKVDEPGVLKDRLDEAWQSIKTGLVRAVSIGFRSLEHSVMEDGGWRFLKWEWMELSAVTVPANADCTISRIKSIDRKLRAASGTSQRGDVKTARFGASQKQSSTKGETPMTISEQISAKQAEESNIVKQLTKFDVENMDEADGERFDDLESELENVRKQLKRLHTIEGVSVEKTAKPVKEVKSADDATKARNSNYGNTTVSGPNKNIPVGIPFARKVRCLALAKGSEEVAAQIAEREYPDDKRIATLLRMGTSKAAVPGAYTGDSGGWAEDIAEAQTLTSEFIEYLRPMTIVGRLQNARRVPFNVKVPRLATGQSGYWVGEAKPSPMTSGVFDTVTLGKTKVASISALTKEQIKFSNISAETAIRDDLADAVVAKMDSTFVSTAAASGGVSPAGLLNGLSAIDANGSGAAADVRSDLQDLFAPFKAANISRRGLALLVNDDLHLALQLLHDNGFRAFPDVTGDGGNVLGFPVISSNHVAAGDVIMISPRDILLADDGEVSIEMSDQTSLEMLDSSLEQDGTSGTGNTTAGMVSMFQAGMVAIKVERYINWQKARSAAVAYIGDAGWNGAATS